LSTWTNVCFPPQFKSEAFQWTADGGTQLLVDPAGQPYSTVVDLGTDGSVLVRSNNPDPYTSYFDLLCSGGGLAPGGGGGGGAGGAGHTGAPEFPGLGGNLENLVFSADVLPTGVSASAPARPPTARAEIGLPAAPTVPPVASGLGWHGRVPDRLFTEFGEDLDTGFLPDSLLLR
jgi:hypothetical protein